MADYNSVYTGAEIDASIAKSADMAGFVQVYNGAPTQVEIPASSLPINPATGDRTGLYYIVFASTADALTLSTTRTRLSMCAVKSVNSDASSSDDVSVNDGSNEFIVYYGAYHGDTNAFYSKSKTYNVSTFAVVEATFYIHEIWRFQELV